MSTLSSPLPFMNPTPEHRLHATRKRSFDDLLLPSLTISTTTSTPMQLQESPYFFDARKKAKTAPTSPSGLVQITPNTSPITTASESLIQERKSNGSSQTHLTLPSCSDLTKQISSASKQSLLPSLQNLRLLPPPQVQEYSYQYPDTCVSTKLWKHTLTEWCKESNYPQYQSIVDQVSQADPRAGNLTHGLNVLADAARISSIKTSPDEFYQLSNSSPNSMLLVTPPHSPTTQFTPLMSGSLVKAVKKNRSAKHKKSNSFKVRKLKKMLDERTLLTGNDQFESQKTVFRANPALPKTPPQKKVLLSTTPKSLQSPSRKNNPILITNKQDLSNKPVSRSNSDVDTDYEIVPQSPTSKSLSTQRRNSHRKCVSCHVTESPCWRPSWSKNKHDQLCNSCGLRYKKTHTRCTNPSCRKIPSKGELALMKSNKPISVKKDDGTVGYSMACLFCGHPVAVDE